MSKFAALIKIVIVEHLKNSTVSSDVNLLMFVPNVSKLFVINIMLTSRV